LDRDRPQTARPLTPYFVVEGLVVPDVPELLDEVPVRSLSFVDEPLVVPLLLVAPGAVPVLPPSPVAADPEPLMVPLPEAVPEADPLGEPVEPGAEPVGPLGDPLGVPVFDRSFVMPVEEPSPLRESPHPAKVASAAAVTTATKDFLISMKVSPVQNRQELRPIHPRGVR
jgi:hypothetical protein